MNVIEIEGLHKEYRRLRGSPSQALRGLDLTVKAGGVHGFLGPNGSGKTTTIRCLLGLSKPSAGVCRLFGYDSLTELHEVIRKVGSIVEAPALFATFSGRRNLGLLAKMYDLPETRIDEVLEIVDLADRGRDLVKDYSLGMRQRLAIAAALLKKPELLILDEPANGLDPAGIREVRGLLRELGAQGTTVFVSSHILGEVQQMCDDVAILSKGRCVASGPVSEVLSKGQAAGMKVRINDGAAAAAALNASGIDATFDGNLVRANIEPRFGARVSEALANHGLYASELRADEIDLETVFLELTEEDDKEEVAA